MADASLAPQTGFESVPDPLLHVYALSLYLSTLYLLYSHNKVKCVPKYFYISTSINIETVVKVRGMKLVYPYDFQAAEMKSYMFCDTHTVPC